MSGSSRIMSSQDLTSRDQVTAHFRQRSTGRRSIVTGDVLIAADGFVQLYAVYPDEGDPVWSGCGSRATTEGAPFLSGRSMVMAGHEDRNRLLSDRPRREREGRSLINWIAELQIDQTTWRREDWNRTVDTSEFSRSSKIGISVGSRCRILSRDDRL